jgi:hypothetical protein
MDELYCTLQWFQIAWLFFEDVITLNRSISGFYGKMQWCVYGLLPMQYRATKSYTRWRAASMGREPHFLCRKLTVYGA